MHEIYVCKIDCGKLLLNLKAILWSMRVLKWLETIALMCVSFWLVRNMPQSPFHSWWAAAVAACAAAVAIGACYAIGLVLGELAAERMVHSGITVSCSELAVPEHLARAAREAIAEFEEERAKRDGKTTIQ